MAETQAATLGYGGEFHLHDGSVLYELVEVKEFDVPGPAPREQVETTHLKSPDWRREYTSGFYEDQDIEILLNSRPMSDTDVLLEDALDQGDNRTFKAVLAENGSPTAQVEGTCRVIGYNRGRVTPDGVLEATATVRIVTVDAIEAYAS